MTHRLTVWFMSLFLLFGLLQSALAINQSDLLPPGKAFVTRVERVGDTLNLTLDVADGYYVYRDRIHLSSEPPGLTDAARIPEGLIKEDPYLGRQKILEHSNLIVIPLPPGAPSSFVLQVRVQGCAMAGVCYPPSTRRLTVGGPATTDWLGSTTPAAPVGEHGQPLTLLAFFLAGLGMAFTACMYPLLPIVSALIAGQGQHLTHRRGFFLSLTYVQGLALTYTLVGVVAGLTGSLLTVWLQQPAVILCACALLVVFALSMFDVIQIQLPAALQTRLASTSNRLSGGHILTVFAMGALSALIIGPCVAPPLALALGYIGSTGDAALGAAALYCMASGLGLPLIVVGTFGGHLLPRAGRWMNNIKYLFGTIMLALAVSLATPFIPGSLIMVLWGALAIGCAVFLRALDTLPVNAHALTRLGKALGLLLFLVGATELVGVMAGETNPRYPLRWMHTGPAQAADLRPAFLPVGDAAALDKWLAANPGRPALLDFYADWCVSCKEMDSTTWKDPGMTQALQGFTTMRADVTQGTPAQMALMKRFGLFGPPAIILFDRYGRPSAPLIGYIDADALKNKLMPLQ